MSNSYNVLPPDCQVNIASFLTGSERARFASVSKECKVAVDAIRVIEECPRIAPLLGKRIEMPLDQTESSQLVTLEKIRKNFTPLVQKKRKLLQQEDWMAMKADPKSQISNLNIDQLGIALDRIESNMRDKPLVDAFVWLRGYSQEMAQLLPLDGGAPLSLKAKQVREWLDSDAAADLPIESLMIDAIQREYPTQIMKAILESNQMIDLGLVLGHAVEFKDADSVRAILEDSREIDEDELSDYFMAAVCTGELDLVTPFLECSREFDMMLATILAIQYPKILNAIKKAR